MASALALDMDKMPCELCLSLGVGALHCDTGVETIMELLQKNLAPDASDAGFRNIIEFFGLRRAHLTLDECPSRFVMAHRRAEARLPNNGIYPDVMKSFLCLHHAGITPNQKSMVLSSTGGDPSLETMKQHMRRILQSCGMELNQDSLVAKDDVPNKQAPPCGSAANCSPGDGPIIGDANAAPKKKRKKPKKGKFAPPSAQQGNGNTPNQINPRTGYRNRCYGCGSEFHLLPQCPQKQSQSARRVSIAMEPPGQDGRNTQGDGVYTTSIGMESSCGGPECPSKVILDTGATANLVGVSCLDNHNAILKALGRPQAKITPAFAIFPSGDGRVGGAHRAAIIPIAIVGYTRHFMAYLVDADIPALSGKEALVTLGAHLNFCERVLTLESLGADIPLEVSPVGHYPLIVADFPESFGAGAPVTRNGGIATRVMGDKGMPRKNVFFFKDVTQMAKMHPACEGGPSVTLS